MGKRMGKSRAKRSTRVLSQSEKCFAVRFAKTNTGLLKNSALINQCFSAKRGFMFQKIQPPLCTELIKFSFVAGMQVKNLNAF